MPEPSLNCQTADASKLEATTLGPAWLDQQGRKPGRLNKGVKNDRFNSSAVCACAKSHKRQRCRVHIKGFKFCRLGRIKTVLAIF